MFSRALPVPVAIWLSIWQHAESKAWFSMTCIGWHEHVVLRGTLQYRWCCCHPDMESASLHALVWSFYTLFCSALLVVYSPVCPVHGGLWDAGSLEAIVSSPFEAVQCMELSWWTVGHILVNSLCISLEWQLSDMSGAYIIVLILIIPVLPSAQYWTRHANPCVPSGLQLSCMILLDICVALSDQNIQFI